ncbi:MAG: ribonuclease Z [Bacteroidales bacterium]|nr:ribonuclease Z [Bacteroidales bacterium]
MIPFELTILGAGSALPTIHRSATSQFLHYNGQNMLIDCAEGTQIRLQQLKISAMKLDRIFISHLHGDHYFGLIGLINSMHLNSRIKPLKLFGPPELINIIQLMLQASDTSLNFPINFKPLAGFEKQKIDEDEQLQYFSFPVKHRIPAWGFLIKEKPRRNIDPEFIEKYNPNHQQLQAIQQGEDFIDASNARISNAEIIQLSSDQRAYAFCADTAYHEPIVDYIKGVSLLYHEATFMQDLQVLASKTLHSTTVDAANIANKSRAKQLLIGHFSSRYKDLNPLLAEARSIFSNTQIAVDGLKVVI